MSWRSVLFGPEKHDIVPTPERTIVGFGLGQGVTPYGVTGRTSLGLSAVWACVRIVVNGVSQLEWRERRGNADLPLSSLVERPWANRTRREWVRQVVATLVLYQTCVLLKIGSDSENVPRSLIPVPPNSWMPATPADPFGLSQPTEYWVGNRRVPVDDLLILRTGLLPGGTDEAAALVDLARVTFAAALSSEAYASRYWQTGGSPVTVLKTDQALTTDQAIELGNRWAEKRQLGPDHPAVLGMGAEAKPFGADPTAEAAVEARRELVADVARYIGIPTRLVNAPTGDTETYTTTGDSNLDLLRFATQDYIDAICDGISDLLPGFRKVTMDTTRLTRGSHLARAQAWQLALAGDRPWMSVPEVREAEGLPPQEIPPHDPVPIAGGAGGGGFGNTKQPQRANPAKLTAPRVG